MKVEGDPPRRLLFWSGSETKVAWTNIETVKTGRNERIQGMLRSSDLNDTVHMSRKERRY